MNVFKFYFAVLALSLAVVACGDNEEPNGPSFESYLSGTYKTNDSDNKLIVTYNGQELTDKSASFSTADNKTGIVKFSNIVASGEEVTLNVSLQSNREKGGFDFSGTKELSTSTTLTYSGNITMGALTLTLSDQ